jgi:hypothetical protein
VRTLREELSWAAREFHARAHQAGGADVGGDARHASTDEARARAEAARTREAAAKEQVAQARADAEQARVDAERAEDEARRAGAAERPGTEDAPHEEQQAGSGAKHDPRPGQDWREEAGSSSGSRRGEREWGEWAGWTGWGGWPGAAGQHGWADPDAYRDLERLAKQFSRELRSAAWHAQAVSEDALRDLRGILDETIDRIKDEVFKGKMPPGEPEDEAPPAD